MQNSQESNERIKELEKENALLKKIIETQFKTIKRLTQFFITDKK